MISSMYSSIVVVVMVLVLVVAVSLVGVVVVVVVVLVAVAVAVAVLVAVAAAMVVVAAVALNGGVVDMVVGTASYGGAGVLRPIIDIIADLVDILYVRVSVGMCVVAGE